MQLLRVAQFLAVGYAGFGKRGYQINERGFTRGALDVDLNGRNFVVTGATSGLGLVTAQELASRNATVHLLCRDMGRGERVRAEIVGRSGNDKVEVHECDVSRVSEVREFVKGWEGRGGERRIGGLVNNAGVMQKDREVNEEGLEVGYATNTVGTFVLTEMLRPWLEGGGRVVTVSSGGMLTERLRGGESAKEEWDGRVEYARCKRRQVAMTEYWARRWGGKGVFWAVMHPGWADTPGLEKSMPEFHRATKGQLRTVEQGADTIVYLTVADEALKYGSGEFFFDRKPASKHLWMGGTGYSTEEVDGMVEGLKKIAKDRGAELPE